MEVVSASQGVLGPLLGKLAGLLEGECARLKGVRREIRSLKAELTGMHGAIRKYTMLQDPDVQVKDWISLVRELAYDIEDVIDKFVHQLGNGGQHQSGFKEFFRKTARRLKTLGSRHGITNQIDDLKIRLKQVKELKSSYKLDDTACSTFEHSVVDPRLSALFVEEAHLVGIDGPRDDLVKWMLENENSSTKHRKVLSIVGFGGLGKTTLAREVYRKIQGHFHCQAFVSVSQKPNVKKIMKDLISQMPCEKEFIEGIDTWDERNVLRNRMNSYTIRETIHCPISEYAMVQMLSGAPRRGECYNGERWQGGYQQGGYNGGTGNGRYQERQDGYNGVPRDQQQGGYYQERGDAYNGDRREQGGYNGGGRGNGGYQERRDAYNGDRRQQGVYNGGRGNGGYQEQGGNNGGRGQELQDAYNGDRRQQGGYNNGGQGNGGNQERQDGFNGGHRRQQGRYNNGGRGNGGYQPKPKEFRGTAAEFPALGGASQAQSQA